MSIRTINDLVQAAPDGVTVAYRREVAVTLGEFRRDIRHNADVLAARSVRRGAVACQDACWFLTGVLALLQIGAEVVLPPNIQPGTLAGLEGGIDALLVDEANASRCAVLLTPGNGDGRLAPFMTGAASIHFFTSGSTGARQRVPKSLAQFEAEAALLEGLWGHYLGSARTFAMVSHQHLFGMTFRVIWPFLAGRPFDAEMHIAWESLLQCLTGPALLVASPAQLTRLAGLEALPTAFRPRLVVTAGAPLPDQAARDVERIFNAPALEIFGSTEAGVIAWRRGREDEGLWRPLPGVEIAADAGGCLKLRAAHAGDGSWQSQADRISLADDGGFRLLGRADRVTKVEGKRVSLDQLEREIAALPWIEAAAVVTLGDEHAELGVLARLTAAGEVELARRGKFRFERMLRRQLSETQDWAAVPRRWRFVDAMPMDGMGKRRHGEVVALLQDAT